MIGLCLAWPIVLPTAWATRALHARKVRRWNAATPAQRRAWYESGDRRVIR